MTGCTVDHKPCPAAANRSRRRSCRRRHPPPLSSPGAGVGPASPIKVKGAGPSAAATTAVHSVPPPPPPPPPTCGAAAATTPPPPLVFALPPAPPTPAPGATDTGVNPAPPPPPVCRGASTAPTRGGPAHRPRPRAGAAPEPRYNMFVTADAAVDEPPRRRSHPTRRPRLAHRKEEEPATPFPLAPPTPPHVAESRRGARSTATPPAGKPAIAILGTTMPARPGG